MGRRILPSSTKSNVIAAYNSGVPVAQIANDYGIGKSTVYSWAVNDNSPDRRNKSYNLDDVKTVLRQVKAGGDVTTVASNTGVSVSTCYNWIQKYKDLDLSATAYSKQFKRNVINSLHDGHSKHKVSTTYGITLDTINSFVDEFKDGGLDTPIAIKSVKPEQPAIQTMSISVLDSFTDVFKLLVNKGLDIDNAVDVAKQLSTRIK